MTLAAGTLNRQIVIEGRVATKDELNQPIESWQAIDTVWANIKGDTGMSAIRQSAASQGLTRDINSYSFRIRYYPTGLNSGMRCWIVGEPDAYYDIKQIRHDRSRREWTDLVCEEGGNDG